SLHLPDDAIRWLGLALLVLVGLGLLIPPLGHLSSGPFTASLSAPSAPAATASSSGSPSARSSCRARARSSPPSPWPARPATSAFAQSASPWASPSAPRSRCSPSRWQAAA